MSDTAPASDELELISDNRCVRYNRAILALLLVNLAATVGFGVLGVHDRHQDAKPNPKPSHTATSTPRPSATPSAPEPSSSPTPGPSLSFPPDPTGSACNIFDPECDSGASS
ncbi:hypothetical protein [Streptomyces sp. NPDC001068]|uniref:hypothetical protein n=1 Tax=Streptomyces sp. NPDC001068 TaxID=3364544 RepID=UPI00369CAD3C